MAEDHPIISVISPSFNTLHFLKDTAESIFGQSYKRFEYIIMDGGSTDGTLGVLEEYKKNYPHFRYVSEKDNGVQDALRKGFAIAKGKYIMNCCISDGYLDMDWFAKCAEVLDRDPEVGIVWANNRYMTEGGELRDIMFRQFEHNDPPQKTDYFYYWLAAHEGWPENNMCVTRAAFDACFPHFEKDPAKRDQFADPWNEFTYRSNSQGFVPYFVRTIAGYGRIHGGQISEVQRQTGKSEKILANYVGKVKKYRDDLLLGNIEHHWWDSQGNILPYVFSKKKFLMEQRLSPRGLMRTTFRGVASAVRKPARRLLESEKTPEFVKKAIVRSKKIFRSRS